MDNNKIRKIIKNTLNEWLNEQYKYDELKLSNLVAIVSEKYPEINYGGCAVFARAFHNVTRLPYMLIIDDGLPDEDPPIHVMIKLSNGKLFDGEGIRTKQQVKEYYRYDLEGKLMFLQDNDGSILDNYYEELGSGLFTHCHKEHYDDILNIIKSVVGNL
jgi:hypothetical protein